MEFLVKLFIQSNFYGIGCNCAKIKLNDNNIKNIHKLLKRTSKENIVNEFDYAREFGNIEIGNTNLDIDNSEIINIEELSETTDLFQTVFEIPNPTPRIYTPEFNVNEKYFWWSGYFKHTNVQWETSNIPLYLLPAKFKTSKIRTKIYLNIRYCFDSIIRYGRIIGNHVGKWLRFIGCWVSVFSIILFLGPFVFLWAVIGGIFKRKIN